MTRREIIDAAPEVRGLSLLVMRVDHARPSAPRRGYARREGWEYWEEPGNLAKQAVSVVSIYDCLEDETHVVLEDNWSTLANLIDNRAAVATWDGFTQDAPLLEAIDGTQLQNMELHLDVLALARRAHPRSRVEPLRFTDLCIENGIPSGGCIRHTTAQFWQSGHVGQSIASGLASVHALTLLIRAGLAGPLKHPNGTDTLPLTPLLEHALAPHFARLSL